MCNKVSSDSVMVLLRVHWHHYSGLGERTLWSELFQGDRPMSLVAETVRMYLSFVCTICFTPYKFYIFLYGFILLSRKYVSVRAWDLGVKGIELTL